MRNILDVRNGSIFYKFDGDGPSETGKFRLEEDAGFVYLKSFRTENYLQPDDDGYVCCIESARQEQSRWEVVRADIENKWLWDRCDRCNRPVVNEHNVCFLRKLALVSGLGCGAVCAAALPVLGFGLAGISAGSFAASIQRPAVVAGVV